MDPFSAFRPTTTQSADAARFEREVTDPRGFLIPQARTFQGLLNSFGRVHSYRWDEAVREGRMRSEEMDLDAYLRALQQERYIPASRWPWDIDVDPDDIALRDDAANPKDPKSNDRDQARKLVRACLARTPALTELKRLLALAGWYGRSAAQTTWGRQDVGGQKRFVFDPWQHCHGDKVQFTYDGVPGVMARSGDIPDGYETRSWDGGSALILLNKPAMRERWVIHQGFLEDADYWAPDKAGRAFGVGYRDYCYWAWWLRREFITWMTSYMEKAGTLGLWLFYFDDGSDGSYQAAKDAAAGVNNQNAIAVPRPKNANANQKAVELIPASIQGSQHLIEIINEFFERHIERLLVGQSMSGGKDKGDGLGGTGRADLARDTKFHLLAYDAERLDETLTRDWVAVCARLNVPGFGYRLVHRSKLPDPAADVKLDAIAKAATMPGKKLTYKAADLYELVGMSKPGPDDETAGGDDPQPGMVGPDGQPLGGDPTDPDGPGGGPDGGDGGGPVPGMANVIAAIARAAGAGDLRAADQLIELGKDRAGLQDLLGSLDGDDSSAGDADADGLESPSKTADKEPVKYDGPPHRLRTYEGSAKRKLSYVGVDLTGAAADRLLALGRLVHDEDLADDGRETRPHVTVRYGLHADEPGPVADCLHRANSQGPVRLTLGRLAAFLAADSGRPYDVLYATVASPDLHRLNRELAALPHTDTHPTYTPHATVAYLKPGTAARYVGGVPPLNLTAACDRVTFSNADRAEWSISLLGAAPADPDPIAYEWVPAANAHGGAKAVWNGPGQRKPLYGKEAEAALAARSKAARPVMGAAKKARDWKADNAEPARASARMAWQKALADPDAVEPHELEQLGNHLRTLTRDEVRAEAKKLEHATFGKVKDHIVRRLLEHVGFGTLFPPGAGSLPVERNRPIQENSPPAADAVKPQNPSEKLEDSAPPPEPDAVKGESPGGEPKPFSNATRIKTPGGEQTVGELTAAWRQKLGKRFGKVALGWYGSPGEQSPQLEVHAVSDGYHGRQYKRVAVYEPAEAIAKPDRLRQQEEKLRADRAAEAASEAQDAPEPDAVKGESAPAPTDPGVQGAAPPEVPAPEPADEGPVIKVKVRHRPFAPKNPKTISGLVKMLGGIDPQDHALKAHFSGAKEAQEFGVPKGIFRKGGGGLDVIAQEMITRGDMHMPDEHTSPTGYLVDLLKKRAKIGAGEQTQEIEAALNEHYRAQQELADELGVAAEYNPDATYEDLFGGHPGVAEALRRSEAEGVRDAEEGDLPDGPGDAGGDGADGGDDSFAFGANAEPEQPAAGVEPPVGGNTFQEPGPIEDAARFRHAKAADDPSQLAEADLIHGGAYNAALRANYFDPAGGKKASSRDTPAADTGVPVGAWRIDPFKGLYGREIEQLREIPADQLHHLVLSEDNVETNAEGRGRDADRYAGWAKEGKAAPGITLLETHDGKYKVTDGHRRVAAAKKAGTPLRAWVSHLAPTGGVDAYGKPLKSGLTLELAKAGKWRPADAPPVGPAPGNTSQEPAAEPPMADPLMGRDAQLDIFGNAKRTARPAKPAVKQSLIPRETERKVEGEETQKAVEAMRDAGNPPPFDPAAGLDARPGADPAVPAAVRAGLHAAFRAAAGPARQALGAALHNANHHPDAPAGEPGGYRRLARQLAAMHSELAARDPAAAAEMAPALVAAGLTPVGRAGETAPFDGAAHAADGPVRDGEPVRVVAPGWVVKEKDGEFLANPARVAPAAAPPAANAPLTPEPVQSTASPPDVAGEGASPPGNAPANAGDVAERNGLPFRGQGLAADRLTADHLPALAAHAAGLADLLNTSRGKAKRAKDPFTRAGHAQFAAQLEAQLKQATDAQARLSGPAPAAPLPPDKEGRIEAYRGMVEKGERLPLKGEDGVEPAPEPPPPAPEEPKSEEIDGDLGFDVSAEDRRVLEERRKRFEARKRQRPPGWPFAR